MKKRRGGEKKKTGIEFCVVLIFSLCISRTNFIRFSTWFFFGLMCVVCTNKATRNQMQNNKRVQSARCASTISRFSTDNTNTHTRVCFRFNLCSSIPFFIRFALLSSSRFGNIHFRRMKKKKKCIIGIDAVYLCKAKASKTFVHCQLFKTTNCLLSFPVLFLYSFVLLLFFLCVDSFGRFCCLKLAQQECKCNP